MNAERPAREYLLKQAENINKLLALRPHKDAYYPPADDVRRALMALFTEAKQSREDRVPWKHRSAIEHYFLDAVTETRALATAGHDAFAAFSVDLAVQLRAWGLCEVSDADAERDLAGGWKQR